ncbi:Uncharacterised protein [Mycobacteroides abscessus subsp. abscessus]|nr:Uncharacterised protein [Mycobacteroides abscessus subsp. abscessus]
MTLRPVVCGRTLEDARRYARVTLGLTDIVAVSRPEHLRGLHIDKAYETPEFGHNPNAREIRASVRIRQATTPKEPAPE